MRATRLVSAVAAAALGVTLAGAPATAQAPSTSSALPAPMAGTGDEITFTGHGWGHGRGMGQYGALGYAVDHGWTWTQILDHFYGGTTMGDAGNPEMSVELLGLNGKQLVVIGRSIVVNGTAIGGTSARLTANANGTVTVERGSNCAGPWTPVSGTFAVGGTRVSTPNGSAANASVSDLIRVCETNGERAYRGTLSVVRHNNAQMTINHLPTESYLRGVVPRESPASWGALGGGRGMQALKAQAVAARSYALSSTRSSGALTCDTTSCQVYGGAGMLWPSGQWATPAFEQLATDTAIAETSGKVRRHSGGSIARTEFSSSTGGNTVGGTFPAVPDEGDDISSNPNHTWTTTLSTSTIASRLGVPGPIRDLRVTNRNGLGDWGGRVLQVVVVDANGSSRTYTGAAFRSAMGTSTFKSDWFTFTGFLTAQARSVVRALYQDVLLRGVDTSGLATWSSQLVNGRSQTDLVNMLTRSEEYIRLRVAKAYREVLGREPDATGAQNWFLAIRADRATVDDVQRRFYDSVEFFEQGGGTPAGYVELLYRTMLGRSASASESVYWVGQMASAGRGAVVDAIWFSLEAAKVRAGGYYRVFLQREPDVGGLLTWANVLLQRGEGPVRIGIAGSLEYRNLALTRFPV